MQHEQGHGGFWFTEAQVKVRLAQQDNDEGISLMEHRMAEGFSPPWHVHHDEAETFHVLEGRFLFRAGEESRTLAVGETLHVPAGVPHSFKVLSPSGGRMVTMTRGGFEAAVRAVSSPAPADALPDSWEPGPDELAAFARTFSAHGIDLIGPPL